MVIYRYDFFMFFMFFFNNNFISHDNSGMFCSIFPFLFLSFPLLSFHLKLLVVCTVLYLSGSFYFTELGTWNVAMLAKQVVHGGHGYRYRYRYIIEYGDCPPFFLFDL